MTQFCVSQFCVSRPRIFQQKGQTVCIRTSTSSGPSLPFPLVRISTTAQPSSAASALPAASPTIPSTPVATRSDSSQPRQSPRPQAGQPGAGVAEQGGITDSSSALSSFAEQTFHTLHPGVPAPQRVLPIKASPELVAQNAQRKRSQPPAAFPLRSTLKGVVQWITAVLAARGSTPATNLRLSVPGVVRRIAGRVWIGTPSSSSMKISRIPARCWTMQPRQRGNPLK